MLYFVMRFLVIRGDLTCAQKMVHVWGNDFWFRNVHY